MKPTTCILVVTILLLAGCSTPKTSIASYAWDVSVFPIEDGTYQLKAKLLKTVQIMEGSTVDFQIDDIELPGLNITPNKPATLNVANGDKPPVSLVKANMDTTEDKKIVTYEVMIKDGDTTLKTKGEIRL